MSSKKFNKYDYRTVPKDSKERLTTKVYYNDRLEKHREETLLDSIDSTIEYLKQAIRSLRNATLSDYLSEDHERRYK